MSQININNDPSAEVIIYENGTPVHVSVEGFVVTWGDIHGTLSAQTDLQTALDAKVDENSPITGATKTKITYDSKGLVTAGADAGVADISGLQTALDLKVPYTGATGNVTLGEYGLTSGFVQFDTTPTTYTPATGNLGYNDTTGTLETTLKGGSTQLKIGRDMFERVVNKTGVQLTKAAYQAVRISTAQGQRLGVALAQANNDNNSADTIGLAVETIDINQEGNIFTVGEITGINTTGSLQGETWSDGDVLYLSPTTAGRITNIKPVAPQHLVIIGYITYAHQNNGKIYVKTMNGWELGELHDVNTTGATNGQVLKFNGTIWTPATDAAGTGTVTQVNATAGTGISVSGSPITTSGTLTITNTAPDQTVSLTQGGTTTITGTYPNFTISSADQYQGTVTNVSALTLGTTGTDLSSTVANGTTTPTITLNVPTASATNRGVLSSADWSTFNSKQNALTNPVTGTGTSGQVSYWNGTTTQTGSNNLFWDNTNGRLGIGTNSLTLTQRLRIVGDATTENLLMDRFSGFATFILRRANGTESSPTGVLNGDILGIIGFRGYNGSAFASSSSVGILSYATENWTTTANGSYLVFATTPNGSTTRNDNLRIWGSGNVTIQNGGTFTDAGYRLDINGTERVQGRLTVSTGGADITGLTDITGTTATDGGQLGSELLSSANWTLGAGWTGDFATGFAHSSGTATLTNTLAAVNGTYYLIAYTVTNRTTGSFSITFGGTTTSSITATGSTGPRATSTASVVVTPTTDFNGTIVFSIKAISASSASVSLRSSAGTVTNEIRNATSNTNTLIGLNAGSRNFAVDNTFIGSGAGTNNTTAVRNTFIGRNSGANNTIGSFNVGVGDSTLSANLSGGANTAIGSVALFSNTTGQNNTAIGGSTLVSNTGGNNNVAIGSFCLNANTTGEANTAIAGLQSNTTGNYNSVIGNGALNSNVGGSNNIAFGRNSGRYAGSGTTALTDINNSIFLGYQARAANATGDTNELVIGYDALGLGSNTTVIGNSSTTFGRWWGNLLLGTSTNSTYLLDVNGTARIQNDLTISDTRNIILATGTGTKIGTATSQKLGFFNATPITQPTAVTSAQGIADALTNLGLLASSTISGGGGSAYSVSTKTSNFTETATSGEVILLGDTTGGTFTITLPTAVSNTAKITIKKIAGSNNLTIDGNGSQTIDGGLTADLVRVYESITLISDNSNWHII